VPSCARSGQVLVAVEDLRLVDDLAVDHQSSLVEHDTPLVELKLDIVSVVGRAVTLRPITQVAIVQRSPSGHRRDSLVGLT